MLPDKKIIQYTLEELKGFCTLGGKPSAGVVGSEVFSGSRVEWKPGGVEGRRVIAAGRGRYLPVIMTLQPVGKGFAMGRGRPPASSGSSISESSEVLTASSLQSTPELAVSLPPAGLNPNAKEWSPSAPPPSRSSAAMPPPPPSFYMPSFASHPSTVLGRPVSHAPPTCFPLTPFPMYSPASYSGYRTSVNPPPTTVS
eukprot:TRINITY_DN33955_c0_g1_i1.p1 TRINITY_DN33955_c0_g1~~TRINITY_DN33955_c0_g1_i1.p1  ORF type:complete len:198 (+),score=5.48 TRINITY_DN33955_c0_g1_i1:76-669(+)